MYSSIVHPSIYPLSSKMSLSQPGDAVSLVCPGLSSRSEMSITCPWEQVLTTLELMDNNGEKEDQILSLRLVGTDSS